MKTRTLPVLLAFVLAGPAWGASVSWTGAGDGTSWHDPANWSPGLPGPGDSVVLIGTMTVLASSQAVLDLSSLTLGDGGAPVRLTLSTGMAGVNSVLIRASSTLEFSTGLVSSAGSFVVEPGGRITQSGPTAGSTVAVRITASVFDLQAGATVTLTGKGCAGGGGLLPGAGPGGGYGGDIGTGGGGGGYGGVGGNAGNSVGNVGKGGPAFGVQNFPSDVGTGGGGGTAPCWGGPGGGLFVLKAATATLSGRIEADGTAGTGGCLTSGGGGSGGGILIETQYLHGRGTLRASGGAGGSSGIAGGGGAGGRISVRVSALNMAQPLLQVPGGAGGTGANPGSVGAGGTAVQDPKIWQGGGGGACSAGANWIGNVPPASGENVVFGSTNPAAGCTWDLVMIGGAVQSITLMPEYQGVLEWNSVMSSITGRFSIQGGTVTMNNKDIVHPRNRGRCCLR